MLSSELRSMRDRFARHEEEGITLPPEQVAVMTRRLTMYAAQAVELESARLAKAPLTETLRLAEKLTRQGVRRGAGEQPLLSRMVQKLAERIAAHFNGGDCIIFKEDADRLIARLNELSAHAWALEEKAAGVTTTVDVHEQAIVLGDEMISAVNAAATGAKVVDFAAARRERFT